MAHSSSRDQHCQGNEGKKDKEYNVERKTKWYFEMQYISKTGNSIFVKRKLFKMPEMILKFCFTENHKHISFHF